MYRIAHILDKNNFRDETVSDFLEERFLLKDIQKMATKASTIKHRQDLDEWGSYFKDHLPRNRHDRFHYICRGTGGYHYSNYQGRACQKFVWPEFFKLFPKGKILLLDLDEQWFHATWNGQFDYAKEIGWDEEKEHLMAPQDMSGLKTDNFPFSAMQIAQFGIYPLILFDIYYNFIVNIYVPSRAFEHSQMHGPFRHVLMSLHHVFDDQWTFDGYRGPKSRTLSKYMKPTACLDYLGWVVQATNARMSDLLKIEDALKREQLAMTFNRAVCDGILAVTTQLPYMSKVFFFGCLDKLANIMVQTNRFEKDTAAWKHVTSLQFLKGELMEFVRSLPAKPANNLTAIIETASEGLEINRITPELLRDFRNSLHGYQLTRDSVERLFRHSGEIDNDVTLLATPLLLYILNLPWSIS